MTNEKRCPKCGQVKSVTQFCHNKSSKDGLNYWCRECALDNQHKWKNKDRNHYQELRRISRSKWGITPRGRYTVLKTNVKKTGHKVSFTSAEFVEWLSRQGNRCHYCGIELGSGIRLTQINIDRKDHAKDYILENIALACKRCNLIKSTWFTEAEMLEIANRYIKPKMNLKGDKE